MRTSIQIIIFLAVGLTAKGHEKDGAAERYLDGYLSYLAGQTADIRGNAENAIGAYEKARTKIVDVRKKFPEWQPEMVEYRLKSIQIALHRLKNRSESKKRGRSQEALNGSWESPATSIPTVPKIPHSYSRDEGNPTSESQMRESEREWAANRYLDGFLSCRVGEEAEISGDHEEAVTAYQTAREMIDGVKKRFPDWKPRMVEYRLDRIEDALRGAASRKERDENH